VLRITIQRGNWSRGKEGNFGNKEEFIGNFLELGNQVRGAD